jgi:hypothetical protein
LFDEIVLEKKSFHLVVDHGKLYVGDATDKDFYLAAVLLFVEITGYSAFQVFGFSDINNLIFLVIITIYTRIGGDGF